MFPESCKAILKTIDNNILEYGKASISIKDKSIDFTAQFVPLIKIGAQAKIICIENNVSTHVITGSVYLSSDKLLRLVNIRCVLISGAEKVLSAPVSVSAQIYMPELKNGIFSKKIVHRWKECLITNISLDRITFRSAQIMCEYENDIKIKIGSPVFDKDTEISLRIAKQGLMFGKKSKYHYHILSLRNRESSQLEEFIWKCSLALVAGLS